VTFPEKKKKKNPCFSQLNGLLYYCNDRALEGIEGGKKVILSSAGMLGVYLFFILYTVLYELELYNK
jgi:hypothetical protein